MKIALSAVWIALGAAFVAVGWDLQVRSSEPLPVLEASNPHVEISSEGFHLEIDVAGTPLEGPFAEFEADVNEFLATVGATLQQTLARAALGCFLAAGLCAVALVLTWRTSPA